MSELQGIGRFKFHEVGKLEEFKRLSAQAMEIVRAKDTGTLQYEIYFSDDQSECIVLERYTDSEVLLEVGPGRRSQRLKCCGLRLGRSFGTGGSGGPITGGCVGVGCSGWRRPAWWSGRPRPGRDRRRVR